MVGDPPSCHCPAGARLQIGKYTKMCICFDGQEPDNNHECRGIPPVPPQ